MDASASFSSPLTTSTMLSSSNRKRKFIEDEGSTTTDDNIIPSKRARFYGTYIPRQPFSLPETLMHYISKHPSSAAVYQKLIRTCKYFFIKNPFILVSSLCIECDEDGDTVETLDGENHDISNLTNKIWITDELKVTYDYDEENEQCYDFSFLSKIYRCDAKKCTFEYIDMSFSNLLLLASNAEKLSFNCGVTVTEDDGSIVPVERIVAALPKLKEFGYNFYDTDSSEIVTSNTVQELLQVPHFSSLTTFSLTDVPQSFDIDRFYAYSKANKTTKFHLEFDCETSAAFEKRLQQIIDEILSTETHEYMVPFISFETLDSSIYEKMLSICTF